MKREEAYYYRNLLLLGFSNGYNEWLNNHLETEDTLSDVVLELSWCGTDVKKTVSVLNNYCSEQQFDESVVADKLRLFFKEAYHSGKMGKQEMISNMYQLVLNIGCVENLNMNVWGSMYYLSDFYSMAEDGTISWESFDFALFSYLDSGIPVDHELIWSKNKKK